MMLVNPVTTTQKLTIGQVLCQPIVPISFLISFTSLVAFFFYCIKSGITKTDKQISWILTFASSLVCTIISIPFFLLFWYSGWDMNQLGTDSALHTAIVCFFITYLILDLSLGSIYYRNRITLLTGWIHHPLYIGILVWLLRSQSSSFFSTNCLLELPTLLLALGSFKDKWRCDLLFACTFFVLRLVFHAYMIVALKQRHRLETLWLVAVIVFPLHLYWFYGIVTQTFKRYCITWKTFSFKHSKIDAAAVAVATTTSIIMTKSTTSTATTTRRKSKHGGFLERICTV